MDLHATDMYIRAKSSLQVFYEKFGNTFGKFGNALNTPFIYYDKYLIKNVSVIEKSKPLQVRSLPM